MKRNIGVLGMKSMANGIILRSGVVTSIDCLQDALSLPISVVITGIESLELLYGHERRPTCGVAGEDSDDRTETPRRLRKNEAQRRGSSGKVMAPASARQRRWVEGNRLT